MPRNKDVMRKRVLHWVLNDLLWFVFPKAYEVFNFEKKFVFTDKGLAALDPDPRKKGDVRHVDNLIKVFRKDRG